MWSFCVCICEGYYYMGMADIGLRTKLGVFRSFQECSCVALGYHVQAQSKWDFQASFSQYFFFLFSLTLCVCVRAQRGSPLNTVRLSFPLWSSRLPVTTAFCTTCQINPVCTHTRTHTCTHTHRQSGARCEPRDVGQRVQLNHGELWFIQNK